jgi:hypothetical protein
MKTTSTWNDTEWDTFTELVRTKLSEGIVTVTFNKKDGVRTCNAMYTKSYNHTTNTFSRRS